MYIRINISQINMSNTNIYVQPQDNRQFDDDFNSSRLNLTWLVDSYINDTLIINLKFDQPLEISPDI